MLDPNLPGWIFREPSHIGIVCEDIERTIHGYEQLGYRFALRSGTAAVRRPGLPAQSPVVVRSAWSLQGPPHLELAEVADIGDEPYLWPSRGHDYVDHSGWWVDDLAAASALLESLGYPLEMTPVGDDERPAGFCYHRTPGGARFELEDGPMRKRILEQQFERVRRGETGVQEYVAFTREH